VAKPRETNDELPTLEDASSLQGSDATGRGIFQEDVARLAAKISLMEELFRLMTADLKFQDFIREILLSVMKNVKCEAGSILEVNHEKRAIFFRAATGISSDRIMHFLIPMGKGIVGYVAESRQPLVVSNVDESSIHLKSIPKTVGFETRNLVALPILIRGKIYGVLELINRIGEEKFSESEVELLQSMCDIIARAIEVRLMLGLRAREAA
jgi:signal transduction protein with GAF and PtsI domain